VSIVHLLFLDPAQNPRNALNAILIPVSLISIATAIIRRKKSIGGFLFYFYYWEFGLLFAYLWNILLQPRLFLPPYGNDSVNQGALILAVFPRLAALGCAAFVSIQLLLKREWQYVEKLRLTLLAALIISSVSVWIDMKYFPKSIVVNAMRMIGLLVWLIYFCVSTRVQRVFRTRDWEQQAVATLPFH
jgi:hypothetical protein